jgi:hypothetical protein
VAAPGDSREDWRLLVELVAHAGRDLELAGLPALRRWVAQELGLADEDALNRLPAEGLVPDVSAAAPTGGE